MKRNLLTLLGLILLLGLVTAGPLMAQQPGPTPNLKPTPPSDEPSTPEVPEILLQPGMEAPREKIHPRLLKILMEDPEGLTRIMIEMTAAPDLTAVSALGDTTQRRQAVVDTLQAAADIAQAQALGVLSEEEVRGNAADIQSFWAFGGIAARADLEAVVKLAALPSVSLVRPEAEYRLAPSPTTETEDLTASDSIEWNISRVRADLAWDALHVDGSGVLLANVDSGVDWQHPALHTHYLGYDPHGLYQHACSWYDATGAGATYPADGNGHGTHTMGTAVGQGGIGVAPGAKWIAVRAFDSTGYGLETWIHAAYQWILDPGPGCSPPDIVSNSWSSSAGDSANFRTDIQALHTAGVFAPFAAGNDGPSTSSVDAPASYPETFSVGALTNTDAAASFSSRGPSIWFGSSEVKPEISAPGVDVRSSLPGGAYGLKNGTSMATPHAAGIAALMLQGDPTLTVAQIESALEQTASPLGSPIPNNDTGYGRIDAYSAVAPLLNVGIISGTVTNAATSTPISAATVTATPAITGASSHISTDSSGRYVVSLAPNLYLVTASAYGFSDQSRPVTVYTNVTTIEDFALQPLPSGTLNGRVLGSGLPIGAEHAPVITIVDTPVSVTANADGYYSTSLPVGNYTLTVSSLGHRVAVTTSVPILADTTTVRNFDLPAAPSILLVDGGQWYYESHIDSYQQALDELLYAYDTWSIDDPYADPPDVDDLTPYDVVFWSSPEDSPGYVNAGAALRQYLDEGGELFLSGQNVAYYDDYYPFIDSTYLTSNLKVTYIRDNSGIFTLDGINESIFEGLNLAISGAGGANNQTSPDEISLTDSGAGHALASYVADGSGGQQVGTCLPYKAIFLSFGFEAINDAQVRTQVISRSMAFFEEPPPSTGVDWLDTASTRIGPRGDTMAHTLRLRSIAETGSGDTFHLSISGNAWQTDLSAPSFSLAPCASATVTISVTIPATATWAAADKTDVSAASQTYPDQIATATVHTESPAPVLLVDDDRFYNVEGYYTQALQTKGIPYQLWNKTIDIPSPLTDTLAMYPIVLWVSAYDWFQPLTSQEETRMANYLENGGALYYNGQDYLYRTEGPDAFAQDYLGVAAYTEDAISTVITGDITSPVGAGLGPAQLSLPYRNFSDALTPTTSAQPAAYNQMGLPNSLTNAGADWRTSFFAFDPDGLPTATGSHLIQRTVGWLSWLGGSQVTPDRTMLRDGDTVTYTVRLLNDGWEDMATASMTATFPAELSPIPGSIQGGALWDAASQSFVWQGSILRDQGHVFTYQATIASPLGDGKLISHTVWMGYDNHRILFDRENYIHVNYPLLSDSTFTVSPSSVATGDWLTYTLRVHNTGFGNAAVTVDNPLPAQLDVSESNLWVSEGDAQLNGRQIVWSVPLSESHHAVMTYTGWLTRIPSGFVLRNHASLYDGLRDRTELHTVAVVDSVQMRLPLIFKN
jgi:uncharacterized repeat protein (TIGR01451 family)